MVNKDSINSEFWKAIYLHYEKECYEDVLKDACFYLIELVQNKSDNYDMDGEKLINNVFSEKNPKLLINKNQTESERDEQRGFGYLIRGLICSIRNPLSHSKNIKYTKEEVDSIIVFMNNIILPKLDETKEFGYVDDWFKFIFIENTTDSKKYSDKVLVNISKKDKYELMKEIVEKLEYVKEGKYKYFINKLYEDLTAKAKNEIIVLLNRKLIKASDDKYLRMFFDHFNPEIWDKLDDLVTARIEEIVYKSIHIGELIYSPFDNDIVLVKGASLSIWVSNWVNNFSNNNEIVECLINKLDKKETGDYTLKYFYNIVSDKNVIMKYSDKILKGLNNGKICYKKLLEEYFVGEEEPDFNIFKEIYYKFKDSSEDDLPF